MQQPISDAESQGLAVKKDTELFRNAEWTELWKVFSKSNAPEELFRGGGRRV